MGKDALLHRWRASLDRKIRGLHHRECNWHLPIQLFDCHYARTDTNEIGMATEKNVVIVDTSFESPRAPIVCSWIEEKVDVALLWPSGRI